MFITSIKTNVTKIINKIINKMKEGNKNMYKIMLDPGHYGDHYNPSTVVKGYYESNFTWDFHLLLKAELEKYGFEVGTTRKNKDDNPGLVDRGESSKGYDLFLSLHSNACATESVDRTDTYYQIYNGDNPWAAKSKEFAEMIYKVVDKTMECAQHGYAKTLISNYDRDGDGYKDDSYGVLRGAEWVNTPGVIIEHSFHTNTRATKWLMDKNNLVKLAKAEAEAIANFFGVKKPEDKPVIGDPTDVIGDINFDGKFDDADVALAKKALNGVYALSDAQLKNADVNNDGKFDSTDLIIMQRVDNGDAKFSDYRKEDPKPEPTPTPDDGYAFTFEFLKKGSKYGDVKTLQRLLNGFGFVGANGKALDVDGEIGPNCEYAIKEFQKANKLDVDGKVGPATWRKLLDK